MDRPLTAICGLTAAASLKRESRSRCWRTMPRHLRPHRRSLIEAAAADEVEGSLVEAICGLTAAASLKPGDLQRLHPRAGRAICGLTAAASLKPARHLGLPRTLSPICGLTAAASLKQPHALRHRFPLALHLRPHRRSLIEAGRTGSPSRPARTHLRPHRRSLIEARRTRTVRPSSTAICGLTAAASLKRAPLCSRRDLRQAICGLTAAASLKLFGVEIDRGRHEEDHLRPHRRSLIEASRAASRLSSRPRRHLRPHRRSLIEARPGRTGPATSGAPSAASPPQPH